MQAFTVLVVLLFSSTIKGALWNCIPVLSPKYFLLGKKAPCNGRGLDANNDIINEPMTKSVLLSFFFF